MAGIYGIRMKFLAKVSYVGKSNSPLVEIQSPEKYHIGTEMEQPLGNIVCRKVMYCLYPDKERKVQHSDEMHHHN